MTPTLSATQSERRLALVLLLAAVTVWGCTFPLVRAALADAPPLLFNLLRFSLAALALFAFSGRQMRLLTRASVGGGLLLGALLAGAYELQTLGLARTSAIHSAFITGLIVVFVPLLSLVPRFRVVGHRRPGWPALCGAAGAFAGLALLTTPAGTPMASLLRSMGTGDLLTLGCAFAFAVHLLVLSHLAVIPAQQLVPLQIGFAAVFMAIGLPLERSGGVHLSGRLLCALVITALLATAGAFSVQTWAQQHLSATTTALVLTLEPVVALLTSICFLGEHLSARAATGAGLILLGIGAAELLSSGALPAVDPV